MVGALSGIRTVEFAGIGPGPSIGANGEVAARDIGHDEARIAALKASGALG